MNVARITEAETPFTIEEWLAAAMEPISTTKLEFTYFKAPKESMGLPLVANDGSKIINMTVSHERETVKRVIIEKYVYNKVVSSGGITGDNTLSSYVTFHVRTDHVDYSGYRRDEWSFKYRLTYNYKTEKWSILLANEFEDKKK